jgi:hypothetical protein
LEDPIDDFDHCHRHVLLFNTWDYGPAYVDEDPIFRVLKGYDGSSDEKNLISQWQRKYGKNAEKVVCKTLSNWKVAIITNGAIDDDRFNDSGTMRVNLMGNKKRRCHSKPYSKLSGVSIESIRNAVTALESPSRLLFNEKV